MLLCPAPMAKKLNALVGEDPFEHQDFLAFGVLVGRKPAAGVVAHDGGDSTALGSAAQLQPFAPDTGPGAGLPFHRGGANHYGSG